VFGIDPNEGERLAERLGAVMEVEHVRGHSRPEPIWRAVRRWRPGILHWNLVDPFAFRGCSWLLLPWGRPSVVTDHLPMLRVGPHWETTRALANRRMAAMIVVGEASRAAAAEHWRRLPPTSTVPNGVALAKGGEPRGDLGSGERLRLLFVGRLEEQKDPLFAVAVAAALRDEGRPVGLRLVGEGSLRSQLSAEVAARGLGDVVELVGWSSAPEEEMGAAHLLLAPSRYEGLPFTPLEALAAGLPLLLSDIPAHRDLAGGSPAIRLVELGNVDAWVGAAVEMAGSLAERSAEARRAATDHSLDRMVESTLGVYRSVIRAGPAGTRT